MICAESSGMEKHQIMNHGNGNGNISGGLHVNDVEVLSEVELREFSKGFASLSSEGDSRVSKAEIS